MQNTLFSISLEIILFIIRLKYFKDEHKLYRNVATLPREQLQTYQEIFPKGSIVKMPKQVYGKSLLVNICKIKDTVTVYFVRNDFWSQVRLKNINSVYFVIDVTDCTLTKLDFHNILHKILVKSQLQTYSNTKFIFVGSLRKTLQLLETLPECCQEKYQFYLRIPFNPPIGDYKYIQFPIEAVQNDELGNFHKSCVVGIDDNVNASFDTVIDIFSFLKNNAYNGIVFPSVYNKTNLTFADKFIIRNESRS